MVNDIVVGATVKSTLTSIRKAREDVDQTSLRLATGRRVNSALDQPTNFFKSSALQNTAQGYDNLLDGIGLGIRTIQQALTGIETIENILNLAELQVLEAREELERTGSALPDAILADSPVGYFRLNDSDQAIANNLGTLGDGGDGIYTNGVGQTDEILFYGAGGLAATFDGENQFIAVPNDDSINTGGPFPERTVELIFNAETTSGRQVLWEEGGNVNNLNIYIDNGVLRVNGRTTGGGGYGPLDISVPIEAGVTYHVGFTQDTVNERFTGYINGEEFGSEVITGVIGNHPNQNGIGAVNENIYFHDDGPGNAPPRADGTFAFTGAISDVAIYNSIIDGQGFRERYEATSLDLSEQFRLDTQNVLDQIGQVSEDSHIRGINLLEDEDLIVDFNVDRTSKLEVEGAQFTLEDLGLDNIQLQRPSQVEEAIRNIRNAIKEIRDYGTKLATDFAVLTIREDFTNNIINTFESGASDLVDADLNEEGANLLAAQTRLDVATTSLSFSGQSAVSLADVLQGAQGSF